MALHLELGAAGEQLACQWLLANGYTILHRNWRHGRDELDIVAQVGSELVVVEVKTRATGRHGDPEDAVSPAKRRKLMRAAAAYVETFDLHTDIRFDIISVVMEPGSPNEVFHIPEAFYPTPQDGTIE